VRGLKQASKIKTSTDLAVAPLAGAWIETTTWLLVIILFGVAPLAGAWIETRYAGTPQISYKVAPLAGAWIETLNIV